MNTTARLQSLPFNSSKTYLTATIFIIGNVLMPQLFHLFPQGGITWLPIYFFTLVGSYLYGWRVGLLTALLSPLVNSLLFGMPSASVLPAILIKSVFLAGAAGFVAYRYRKVSILLLALVVASYQSIGSAAEWLISGSWIMAIQDIRQGIPGMLLQIFGGYWIIKLLVKEDYQ